MLVFSARIAFLAVSLLAATNSSATDGSLYLYLQPLSAAGAKASLSVASVSVVQAEGGSRALVPRLKTIGAPDTNRQRLLAFGRVPVGAYTGFQIRFAGVDKPVSLDLPFTVGQRALLFWLRADGRTPNPGSQELGLEFSIVIPPKPLPDRVGLVTNSDANTVTVFDKGLAQAVAAIDTCAGPSGLAIDRLRRRAFVSCERDDEIQLIDLAAMAVVDRARLSPGDRPTELLLSADGGILVSVNTGSDSISIFDAASFARAERIQVGDGPQSASIDPSGRRAYVFNTLASSISVVDLARRAVSTTLSLDVPPLRGEFNADASRIFVVLERSPYLAVLDPSQMVVVSKVRLNSAANAIAFDRQRHLLYLASSSSAMVDGYDPNALMPLYTLKADPGISRLAIDSDDGRLYMCNPSKQTVIVGRLSDRKVAAEIDVGDGPRWVAVMESR